MACQVLQRAGVAGGVGDNKRRIKAEVKACEAYSEGLPALENPGDASQPRMVAALHIHERDQLAGHRSVSIDRDEAPTGVNTGAYGSRHIEVVARYGVKQPAQPARGVF